MRKECYTAPITAEEKARFVPFIHMLIDTAFDVIVPRFLTGLVSKNKADGSPVTNENSPITASSVKNGAKLRDETSTAYATVGYWIRSTEPAASLRIRFCSERSSPWSAMTVQDFDRYSPP